MFGGVGGLEQSKFDRGGMRTNIFPIQALQTMDYDGSYGL